jgi:hypothetical protein
MLFSHRLGHDHLTDDRTSLDVNNLGHLADSSIIVLLIGDQLSLLPGRKLAEPFGLVQEVGTDDDLPAVVPYRASLMQERTSSVSVREDEDGTLNRGDRTGQQGPDRRGGREEKGRRPRYGRGGGRGVDIRVQVDQQSVPRP